MEGQTPATFTPPHIWPITAHSLSDCWFWKVTKIDLKTLLCAAPNDSYKLCILSLNLEDLLAYFLPRLRRRVARQPAETLHRFSGQMNKRLFIKK